MLTQRTVGIGGKLAPQPLSMGFIDDYLMTVASPPNYPIDVSGGLTSFSMLGNGPDPTLTVNAAQPVHDCAWAAYEHMRQIKAANEGLTETWDTTDQFVTKYLAANNGKDLGDSVSNMLMGFYKQGQIKAFAPVDHTNVIACDNAMVLFHGLYVGVNLPANADSYFLKSQQWTTINGETPDLTNGHCMVKVGTDGQTYDTWASWNALQKSTLPWTALCVDEAWVAITTEDEAANINMAALLADINALGGTGGNS